MKFERIFLLLFSILSSSQISDLPNEVKGFWTQDYSNLEFNTNWKAKWIWLPEKMESDVMLARNSFNLKEKPAISKLRISASSKYELYINGKYVCQGPARSAPHHQSFDILDISSILQKGKNTIAARVHFQRGTKSYHLNGRAGLLVQLDTDEKIIITNENWKVHNDLSWDNNSKPMNRFQLVVNDNINLNDKIVGFETIDFNDSKWENAIPLKRNSGWPSPKLSEKATTLTTPWTNLVPRDIPYLKEKEIKAIKIIQAKLIESDDVDNTSLALDGYLDKYISKGLKNYVNNNQPLIIPSSQNKTWYLVFDFGEVINGKPKLVVEGEKNTEIHVLAAPYVIDQSFTHNIVASNYHDKIILSENKNKWQAMYFKPTRYLTLAIKGNTKNLKIQYAGIQQLQYPFEKKGRISVPEATWIEDLWHASTKTINVCTTDAYTDNYRERRQYAQTGYYAALGNFLTFGDYALQRRYLVQIAQEQQANGLMPAYAPLTGDDFMVILDSNCLWIRSLYSYLLYSGDYKTVKELLPFAERLMKLLNSYTNKLEMIDSPPFAYWLDHTLNDRTGANLNLNGHYLGALEDYSKILKWLDKTKESDKYLQMAKKLRKSLQLLWDNDKQLFADSYNNGRRSNQYSEHGNAMALAGKIANLNQGKAIANTLLEKDNHNFIKRENGIVMVSPAMSFFLHKGLAEYGYEKASLNLLYDRFKHMLKNNTNGTLWEEWWRNGTGRTGEFVERTRSDAQTESVFPPILITEYVFGLQTTKPGMAEVIISKPNFNLKNIEGQFPSPYGKLSISWQIDDKSYLKLSIPDGMLVKIDLLSLNSKKTIKVNFNPINFNGTNKNYIELTNGEYEITF
ncbi:alpha-L-rhamnosidase N-terminal domain-containing protein [Flavobacteriales bacterium]|nr:alpha-L-rhamnosidase N-terminal domain-containing protein [Flavobacteriales bacterium]